MKIKKRMIGKHGIFFNKMEKKYVIARLKSIKKGYIKDGKLFIGECD